jgi:hypothetical protein
MRNYHYYLSSWLNLYFRLSIFIIFFLIYTINYKFSMVSKDHQTLSNFFKWQNFDNFLLKLIVLLNLLLFLNYFYFIYLLILGMSNFLILSKYYLVIYHLDYNLINKYLNLLFYVYDIVFILFYLYDFFGYFKFFVETLIYC